MNKAFYLALALTGASTVAIAQQDIPPAGGQNFAQRKEQILRRMDERMQMMQKVRACIVQAQDDKAARACRPARPPEGPEGGYMERGGK
ncbi:MAG TPA: hypothetical protein VI363_11015 [Burkholderiales bacterium]